ATPAAPPATATPRVPGAPVPPSRGVPNLGSGPMRQLGGGPPRGEGRGGEGPRRTGGTRLPPKPHATPTPRPPQQQLRKPSEQAKPAQAGPKRLGDIPIELLRKDQPITSMDIADSLKEP